MKGMMAMLHRPFDRLKKQLKLNKTRRLAHPLSSNPRGRLLLFFLAGCMFLLLIPSFFSAVQASFQLSSDSLTKWTRHISSETLFAAVVMEMPEIKLYVQDQVKLPKVSHVLVEMATTLNPEDPRTLIRSEIPGFSFFDDDLIVAGQGVSYTTLSYESSPPLDVVMAEREAVLQSLEENEEVNEQDADPPAKDPALTTGGRKVVLIYHTHNRESWLPHLPSVTDPDEAFHKEINITKVGQKLGEELEKRGIGAQVDLTDIGQKLDQAGLNYSKSYDQSREVIETALQKNDDILFMFDLHRDSAAKEHTTFEMKGKTYARPFFVIGKNNPNYEKNVRFAEELNSLLEERYPGLSRGIVARQTGHGEYNQSISEHNILIEIGGVENTLEESYRTAEILAEVITDLYWDAEKVDAPPASTQAGKQD
jgi:stage II sporulation protein P